MLLTVREVAELTGRERRSAQRRALDAMGVPYRVRPDSDTPHESTHGIACPVTGASALRAAISCGRRCRTDLDWVPRPRLSACQR